MLNIGHRGAMGHAPENTLASFRKALELGADCIELDVYLVEDQLLVFHDDYLERTTNGQGLLMEQSLAYLRSLDAGEGERIPTLEEVCSLVNDKVGINVELKGPGTAKAVVSFIDSLAAKGWEKTQFLVSSFDRQQLQTCRILDAELLLGVLFNCPLGDNLEFACKINATALHPSLTFVDEEMVDSAHNRNYKVFVFTVNDQNDIAHMEKIGADGVFTNYPEMVSKRPSLTLNMEKQNDRLPCSW